MIRPHRLVSQLVPCVWGDRRGALHIDVPGRLRLEGIDDSDINRRIWGERMLTELRGELGVDLPRVLLVAHLDGMATQ